MIYPCEKKQTNKQTKSSSTRVSNRRMFKLCFPHCKDNLLTVKRMQIVVEGPLLVFLACSDHLVESTQLIFIHVIYIKSIFICNSTIFCANWLQKCINVEIFV